MKTNTRILLSLMMFLQFFVWGAWYVTAPNYLGTIGFGAEDFGWTYSVGPIAGIISPFFVGMIADRFFPAQRVLGVMHLMGGVIMFLAASLMCWGVSKSGSPKLRLITSWPSAFNSRANWGILIVADSAIFWTLWERVALLATDMLICFSMWKKKWTFGALIRYVCKSRLFVVIVLDFSTGALTFWICYDL